MPGKKGGGGGGTGVTCYVGGTRIRSALGDVTVESIRPGDRVIVLRDGCEVLEAVTWVGQISVDLSRHAYVETAAPIRIGADAIAPGQPRRDLYVSPEHCLIIDGLCVPAKLLVNGASITSERRHAPFTYHHLELDRHGILFAENLPAESYLDTGNRSVFDRADGPRHLHPRFLINGNAERWLTEACAPLAQVPQDVTPIWSRLAERAADLGYDRPMVVTRDGPDLRLRANDKVLRPLAVDRDAYTFVVPGGVSSLTLMSRVCIPADRMVAPLRDTRRLGVRVHQITIQVAGEQIVLAADHPSLVDGWHEVERDATSVWRWTDGAAHIPTAGITGPAVVTVRCEAVDQYPVYDDRLRLVA